MKNYNSYWIEKEKQFLNAIEKIEIPNSNLDMVSCIEIKSQDDINKIANAGGCYWIWTNEPVSHTMHKHKLPDKINSGQIIYNGIAKDDVKGRVFHHLFGYEDAGWSGISMDIYKKKSQSHRKKAMAPKGKVPFIFDETQTKLTPIKTKEQLFSVKFHKVVYEYLN